MTYFQQYTCKMAKKLSNPRDLPNPINKERHFGSDCSNIFVSTMSTYDSAGDNADLDESHLVGFRIIGLHVIGASTVALANALRKKTEEILYLVLKNKKNNSIGSPNGSNRRP